MATQSDKTIVLYSVPTPNGMTASIFLEELKEAYSAPTYEAVTMSIMDKDIGKKHNQVKTPWYLDVNPNGRIPAITDTRSGFNVFETSAVLLYLAREFDTSHKFSYDATSASKEEKEAYSTELQWIFFAHGGLGPMQGQANHFKGKDEKIEYAINRYEAETRRLYGVLESRLAKSEWLAGGRYGIADIKAFGWVNGASRIGIDLAADFPTLAAWYAKIDARPAVQRGKSIPSWQ